MYPLTLLPTLLYIVSYNSLGATRERERESPCNERTALRLARHPTRKKRQMREKEVCVLLVVSLRTLDVDVDGCIESRLEITLLLPLKSALTDSPTSSPSPPIKLSFFPPATDLL